MNRINRVTSILIQLQSKKIISAKEIAQRFNISLRTVYLWSIDGTVCTLFYWYDYYIPTCTIR